MGKLKKITRPFKKGGLATVNLTLNSPPQGTGGIQSPSASWAFPGDLGFLVVL